MVDGAELIRERQQLLFVPSGVLTKAKVRYRGAAMTLPRPNRGRREPLHDLEQIVARRRTNGYDLRI